ncbi:MULTISPECIES: tape measure protein [unclassified Kaistella]|uniref:tape measure protein n=1 Tax=unclassified Kaistella TaxID=2762626 RepID=UPI002732F4C2|nr:MULTISPECIES: tape measure protein [unclassified Kaistella]MDP2452646.1 tape measure protein [Kaistella sp. SH11-4b]MDP2455555.1 tape measure protein [Kaistella sp. SH40-3]MDP2458459.1 tape measure protein [Kaistella sp. SH19-2b]
MNNNNGALYFGAAIDMTEWRKNLTEMRRDILGLGNQTQAQTRQMDSSFKNLSTAVAGYFSASMLSGFIQQVVSIRGEFQKTEIAFSTMLKSQSKAKDLMAQMVELAAKTPFSLQDVSTGAKQLLAFQVPAEQVVDTLTRMGNIAAGLGVPLGRINLVYGQVMAKGKLAGDDLRQFTEAGIPMLAELAKKFGTSTAEISKMVTAGKIGFKDVQDVLFSMTNEGGMFFNLMEKQSASLSGQVSNLGDSWDQMLNKIGEGNEGVLSDGISAMNYLVENYEDVIEVVGVMIATYGVYRAALIATAAWQQLSTTATLQQALAQGTLTTAQAYGAAATTILQRAQLRLNAAMTANPIGVIIGLLAGLSYVIYKNVSATEAYADIQGKLSEKTRKHSESLEEQRSKIDSLLKVIKDKNTSDEVAKNALKQINSITGERIKGLTIEGIRIGQNTVAIGGYLQMLEKEARLKALIEQKLALEKSNKDIDRDNPNNLTPGERIGNIKGVGDVVRGLTAQERKERAMIEKRLANNRALREIDKESTKLLQQGVKPPTDPIGEALNISTEEVKKKKEAHKRELAEIFSKGSIADLEQRISLWNEALQKASGDTVNELTKNKFGDTVKTGKTVTVAQAKEEAAKIRKAIAKREKEISIQTFDEQITEAERQWNNYYKLAEFYGKEIADAQYKDLINGSSNYLGYLEKEQEALKSKPGILTDEEKQSLVFITEKINSLSGVKTPLQNWENDISDALRGVVSLSEQIEILENKDAEIFQSEGGNTANYLAFKRENDAQIEATKNQIKDNYKSFLAEHQTFEKQKAAITKKYDDLRKQAKTPEEGEKINAAEATEQLDAFFKQMQDNPEYAKMFTDMNSVATKELQKFRDILIEKLKETKAEADKIKIGEFIKKIDDLITKRNPGAVIKRMFDVIGNSASTTEQKLQAVQKGLEGFNEYLKSAGEIASGVQGVFVSMGGDMDGVFGDILNSIQNTIQGLEQFSAGASQAIEGFAKGNILQGVAGSIKAIGGLVKSVGAWMSGDKKKEREIQRHAKEVEALERAYSDLARAINSALGDKFFDASRQGIENLRQQKNAINEMIRQEQSKKKKNRDDDKIAEWRQKLNEIDNSIADIGQSMSDKILNGLNAKGLADELSTALVSAFRTGEDSAEEMGKTVDKILADMVNNALRMKLLEGPMKDVVNKMLSSMGYDSNGNGTFDGLTDQERQDIKNMITTSSQNYASALQEYKDLFGAVGTVGTVNEGMKGDIKGITEKTAGALEAQINTMRVYQAESLAIHRNNQLTFINSLNNLIAIEFNTRRLHSIDDGIQTLISKSKGLAGI